MDFMTFILNFIDNFLCYTTIDTCIPPALYFNLLTVHHFHIYFILHSSDDCVLSLVTISSFMDFQSWLLQK